MGLADAIVAVAVHALTRVPVVQVHVGWAASTGSRAELREVTGVAGAPARGPRRLQLQGEGGSEHAHRGTGSQARAGQGHLNTAPTKGRGLGTRLDSRERAKPALGSGLDLCHGGWGSQEQSLLIAGK